MTKAAELAKMGEVITNSQIGGRRNVIINGGMTIAQRSTSSTSTGYASLDRFNVNSGNLDELAFTQAQVDDAPDDSGLKKSFKFTVTTAESALSAGEFIRVFQSVEGQDIQHFKWGTSSGEEVTASFYVKSSITGTFACSIYVFDANVIMNKPYTISSADTWERKTLTFPAYTAGGSKTPTNDSTAGIYLQWGLLAGDSYNTLVTDWTAYGSGENLLGGQTANVGAVNSTTWQITGVQLEVGSVATPFEHRSVGEELVLCSRYFYKSGILSLSIANASSTGYSFREERTQIHTFPTVMNSAPSITLVENAKALTAGSVTTYANTDIVMIKPTNYAGDLPSGNYWYGGYTADAEI